MRLLVVAVLMWALVVVVAAAVPARPNILFFECDEMDGREVDPNHPTSKVTRKPNLDALMARGVNFVGTYCNNPLCSPSRASMFTGRRSSSIRAWSNVKPLLADVTDSSKPDPTCAKIVGYGGAAGCVDLGKAQNVSTTINLAMAAEGYAVKLLGKMDTGGGPTMTPEGTFATGFHSQGTWANSSNNASTYYPGDLLHSWAQSANISRAVFAPLEGPNKWIDIEHATSNVHDWDTIESCQNFLRDPATTGAGAPPFFLYCSVVNPHPPYTSNATWEAFVERDQLAASLAATEKTFRIKQHPTDAFSSAAEGVPLEWDPKVAHDMALAYHGQIAEVDEMLGRVMAALTAAGVQDKTFVVFTSDHGEMHLEHRLVEKMSMYEPSARVPLIIAGPNVPHGVVSRTFVSLVDLLPTFLDMAGATALPDANLDGNSLAPLINLTARRPLDSRPPYIVSEFAGDCANGPQFMLREGHMKLIQYGQQPPFVDVPPQLFNITEDPYELVNLANDPNHQAELTRLDQVLMSAVDYRAVSRELLIENHEHVSRWVAALPDQWENLLRQAYLDFSDSDMAKFKTWLAADFR